MDITNFIVSQRDAALLIGDYNTYRGQLSKRLLSSRKKLGRATPKNAIFSSKASVNASDIGKNHEFVHLLLYSSERAWAQAMYMKSMHSEDTASKDLTGSTRSHIVSRLNKAAKVAQDLANLLADQSTTSASDVDLLEARAYAYSLSGAEEFEKYAHGARSSNTQAQKDKWERCLKNYSAARVIYSALLRSTKKDVYKEVLAGTVDPSIRYAAYQSHLPRTIAVSTVARQFFPREDSQLVDAVQKLDPEAISEEKATAGSKASAAENIPNTVTWRSRKANIMDASIGQALAAMSTAEAHLNTFLSTAGPDTTSKEKAVAYDDVMTGSQDAADATRHAIDEFKKDKVDEGDPRMQDLRVTSLAINYDLIGWRVGRNRVLIGDDDGASLEGEKRPKPKRARKDGKEWVEKEEGNGRKLARLRDRVVLYDAILQSIDSVKDLRGAARDASFISELDAKRAYFQALKCLNIAYSHSILQNPKNALALFARAEGLAAKAVSSSTSSTDGPPKLDIAAASTKSLHSLLEKLVSQHRGLVELHNLTSNSAIAASKHMTSASPIVERLNEYPVNGVDLKNLVEYPPQLKPVPVKPLFFDVAWNYVEYPGHEKKVVAADAGKVNGANAEHEEKPAKKGWFGFGR